MTTSQTILLDHLVALLSVVGWFAAGVTVALGRARLGLLLLAFALLVTLARIGSVALLAQSGWWFVQEKVLLGLPMLAVAGTAAVLLAGRPLFEGWRSPERALPAGGVIALLSAGYAALAGLMLTFLVGYPLTWSAALIAVAAVCGAALLTARVVAGNVLDAEQGPAPGISRRRLMRIAGGVVVVAAGGAGVGLSSLSAASVSTGGGVGRRAGTPVSVADLRGALSPARGGTRRRHTLTAQTGTVRLSSGREIDAWTYGGQVPGPAITATQGDLLEVTLRNADIEGGVTLHWHGYDVACGEDGAPGVTQHVVATGEQFVYHFRAEQAGTYWYHTHHASNIGVRKGLYGALVVRPRDRPEAELLDLTLPVHTFDGVVVLGDRDELAEHTATVGSPVRLRLINTDSQPHRFALAGTPFRLAAVDGRDLNRPGEVSEVALRLSAGGRYDVVFDMPDAAVALVVDDDPTGGIRLRSEGADTSAVEDTAGWRELDLLRYGEPADVPFRVGNSDRQFEIVLDRGVAMVDGRPAFAHTVNGRGHPSIPDQLVAEGDLVRFTVVNRSLATHPWHLHGHPVLILSRDGIRSSGSPLWMDTFDVRPGEVWEVAFEAGNPGIWMNHCHNLPHAHQGMMLRLAYDGVSTPFGGSGHAH